jgi:hypothetical protein
MVKNVMISFRTVGHKGDIVYAVVRPLMIFRACKLHASDDHRGKGTRILGVYLDGQRIVPQIAWWRRLIMKLRRQTIGISTSVFAHGSLGTRLSLPVCQPNHEISFEIEFLEDGQWKGDLYGHTHQL